MENVFDLVDDFYRQDEEWNTVLRQEYAENFLRTKAWQGAGDDELKKYWDYITVLCIYLGNSDNFLGDMSGEDFIDCVGWCGRNISDFTVDYGNVKGFLGAMSELYAHLQRRKVITSAAAPREAEKKLLTEDGRVGMMDEEGNFLPGYARYGQYATPDLPAKVFLNISEKLNGLLSSVRTFFAEKSYHRDIERAAFLYSGVLLSGAAAEKPGTEEYAQCFWDYFLFDYRMLARDITPLEHFYSNICAGGFSREGRVSRDIIKELLQARLVLFSVEEEGPDGMYSCRDFLTGEQYQLLLPVEEGVDTENFLFLGHIFYNKTMVMNFVRGMLIPPSVRKRLRAVLEQARDWFAVRCGGQMEWEDFIKRNPMFLRHITLIYSAYIRLEGFNYATTVREYEPAPLAGDEVCELIESMMKPYSFSSYDIRLTRQIWSDYRQLSGQQARMPEVWAAAAVKNFIDLNGVYNYDLPKISEMCFNVPQQAIRAAAETVRGRLGTALHDPRYINEEGLLLMLLS